jgi:hypothetical protein
LNAVAGADPGQAQPLGRETELGQDFLEQLDAPAALKLPLM